MEYYASSFLIVRLSDLLRFYQIVEKIAHSIPILIKGFENLFGNKFYLVMKT